MQLVFKQVRYQLANLTDIIRISEAKLLVAPQCPFNLCDIHVSLDLDIYTDKKIKKKRFSNIIAGTTIENQQHVNCWTHAYAVGSMF